MGRLGAVVAVSSAVLGCAAPAVVGASTGERRLCAPDFEPRAMTERVVSAPWVTDEPTGEIADLSQAARASEPVKWPASSIRIGRPTMSPPISNAERVVALARAALGRCVVRMDVEPQGVTTCRVSVAKSGRVTRVTSAPDGTLPAPLVACMLHVWGSLRFDAEATDSTLEVPIEVVPRAD